MAPSVWNAHPKCPAHLRGLVEAYVTALPPAYLQDLEDGEVFDNVDLFQKRLQGYAFTQGFAIISNER